MNLASRSLASSAVLALLLTSAGVASAATLQVGSGKAFAKPCEAIKVAQPGDIIEVDAGSYDGDTCAWSTDNLTVRGVGGRAKIDVKTLSETVNGIPGGKGIFTIAAANATVENFEFSGSKVKDLNGAGIRHEGLNLIVRDCYFHDNENGILGSPKVTDQGVVLVEHSEFARNGHGDGYSHNMYLNHYAKFTLQFSYTHGTPEGHLIKSRALETYVLYNRITDEAGTTASYEIDMPNGGKGFVIGNLIEQGQDTHNPNIIAFGEEGPVAGSALYVVNNTVVNDRSQGGTFVNVAGAVSTAAVLRNNIFFGAGTICNQASAVLDHNLTMTDPKLVDQASFDYHLLAGSPAIDMGIDPGTGEGQSLAPKYHYVHPMSFEVRTSVGTIDIGAYELGGGSTSSSSSSGSTSSSSGSTSSSGGSTSSSGSGGVGGSGGEGGSAGTGGSGGDGAGDEGGCGCRVAGEGQGTSAFAALAVAGLLAARRRRARR